MSQYSFKLPDLGEGIVESEIVDWFVQVGDQVEEDQHIADVMTDKATVELSAPVSGTIVRIGCAAGEMLAVGAELVLIDTEGNAVAAVQAAPATSESAPVQPVVAPVAAAEVGRYSFKLPDLGEGIVESEVVDWHVAVGDQVAEDQHIADVMTDKATVELSAPVSGTVLALACAAGEMAAVGSELVLFAVADDHANQAAAPAAETTVTEPASAVVAAPPARQSPPTTISHVPGRHEVLASPSVRRRARGEDIDLAVVPGTGPAGRITNTDLDNFIAAGGMQAALPVNSQRMARSETTELPLKGMRRIIAQKMVQSKRSIPHYSYVEEIDVTALEELRQHLNENRKPSQPKLTLLPFIMQAMTKVLPEFPFCNARFDEEREVLTQYEPVHIGIATMTEKGLMVPVVKHVEALDIWQSAAELGRISTAAREGSAKADELTGSTITITSLGAIGGIVTTPVINAPETSIIGINKLQERPVVHNGEVVVRKMMNLSSSFDHRIVDGYDAALMVQALKRLLENPASIFV